MSLTTWPNRVWEPTGESKDGKTLWSSRSVEKEDTKRRNKLDSEQTMRFVNKQLKAMK